MALKEDIERLARLPVFACLGSEALRLVAFAAESRRLPPGHVLFRRGEVADAAVLLDGGVLALDEEHEDSLSVRWARAGTLLNEAALFAPGVQTVTATAQEPCTVVAIPRTLMARVLDVHPGEAPALRRYWAARLHARLDAFRASAPP